jgi:hypothetical protein
VSINPLQDVPLPFARAEPPWLETTHFQEYIDIDVQDVLCCVMELIT